MKRIKKNLVRHMEKLCQEIGPRATGSAGNKAAVDYAAGILRSLGYDVRLQEFSCMDWQNNGAELIVDGQSVEVAAAEYALPCEVSGELICVQTIQELKEADLTNKICVMYGDLCKEPLMPKSMIFWNPEDHQTIIRELEQKQPLAVITVSFLEEVPVPIIQDGDFSVPCGTIKGKFLSALLQKKNATLRLMTERKAANAANVIATLGTGKKFVYSAHIDTKPTTPGALDDGSGVAVLLALAEELAQTELDNQLEFVLFNGEDYYSMPGEMTFMEQSLNQPAEYAFAFNVDGVGMQDSTISYSLYECSEQLTKQLDTLSANYPTVEKVDPWPMGDHMLFAGAGIPAVAVTSTQIALLMEAVMHTPKDNLTIIDYQRLAEAVLFLAELSQAATP
ncbi:M28 family metallopeptidase [Candidatus Enterococcus murrayae]|uniref:M28 family peptidase n=1 Tax=Candidatus Enterococcus murrayae TaxID=2815321 RepID=A0ABS3HHI4_9ENTE|nr:M28 family peptidase [Enterococcus sp. MJM16]MBO0452920.1 M28 family peptidase [Enterococcus sp. MJM16]